MVNSLVVEWMNFFEATKDQNIHTKNYRLLSKKSLKIPLIA